MSVTTARAATLSDHAVIASNRSLSHIKSQSSESRIASNKTLLTLLAGIALAGCATLEPDALQPAEITAITQAGRTELMKDVEPLTGPLPLEQAIARAIKYPERAV